MFLSPNEALSIIEHYKYLILFPIIVLEGPIITVIAGFLVYIKYLNGPLTLLLVLSGDFLGDILHYVLGYYWNKIHWLHKFGRFLGYDEDTEKFVENHFKNHTGKTILIAKLSHGIGGFVQIVAGIAKVKFSDFAKYSFIGTMPKSLTLFILGYYLGNSYNKINTYLGYVAFFVVLIVVLFLAYFLSRKYIKNRLIEK